MHVEIKYDDAKKEMISERVLDKNPKPGHYYYSGKGHYVFGFSKDEYSFYINTDELYYDHFNSNTKGIMLEVYLRYYKQYKMDKRNKLINKILGQ